MKLTDKEIQALPPDVRERIYTGEKGKLFAIELYYSFGEGELRRVVNRNLYGHEVRRERRILATDGFPILLEPGHWRIVLPRDIVSIEVHQQSGYFPD